MYTFWNRRWNVFIGPNSAVFKQFIKLLGASLITFYFEKRKSEICQQFEKQIPHFLISLLRFLSPTTLVRERQIKRKTAFLHRILTFTAIQHLIPIWLQTIFIYFILCSNFLTEKLFYDAEEEKTVLNMFFPQQTKSIILVCINLNKVLTSSIKVLSLSRNLQLNLVFDLSRAQWAKRIR